MKKDSHLCSPKTNGKTGRQRKAESDTKLKYFKQSINERRYQAE